MKKASTRRAEGTTLVFVAPWECSRAIAQLPRKADASVVACFIEAVDKDASLPWHRQKLVLVLSAMRHFADALAAAGYRVDYRTAPSYEAGLLAADVVLGRIHRRLRVGHATKRGRHGHLG